jgi:spore coat polysaccharide biosynthesis protein SpsF (cytidylyltransferase family)
LKFGSFEPSDDPIAAYCGARDTECARGPLLDVAVRMLVAAQDARLDAFVRVNGDSPLLDQALVGRGAELMRLSGADLVTNVRPRTFPPGQSVEVVRTDALAGALSDAEHVTGPLYDSPFVVRFRTDPPRTRPSLTLDTAADHARLEAILEAMPRAHWEYGWEEVLALA